ncbi:A-kinase anchor protein 12 isoform X2 [Embiotoca jacksoni]|uniref:A-kinase anchor protein 12 isoform X2 n=1 Tax=Embiotoca jacksoni TaxID=100190 RepID=UPI003703CCFC
MGDAQSAQRDGRKDAAAEEDEEEEERGGRVEDFQTQQNTDDKVLRNNGQISEVNGKADGSTATFNGHCDDEEAAEDTEELLKEETRSEHVDMNERNLPDEDEDDEEVAEEMIQLEAKQNELNESFRRFFSNIGLKLTVKSGSAERVEMAAQVPDSDVDRPEDTEDTAGQSLSPHESDENESMVAPTLTDVTLEEKTTESKEESDLAGTSSPVSDDAQQETTPEEEETPHPTSSSGPDEEVLASPFKRFFTSGIFSGLRKKKKSADFGTAEKELVDIGKEMREQPDRRQDEEVAAAQTEPEEEIQTEADAAKPPPKDPSDIVMNEPEVLSSQEKVQASPLKRLLSASSLKKPSKKQTGRKSSDAKLSDSGEQVSDQLLSTAESAESPAVAAPEDDGAWASFKKLMTPKKRRKTSSLSHEDAVGPAEETKSGEGEQISDQSMEEGKKRKDSSVSWEAVLCGSGKRRSRKTSDSEEENQDCRPKQEEESPLESYDEIRASTPKQADSPAEGDGGSTWKSFKKLVTPKRKAKDEDEGRDNVQSDNEGAHDESSFSLKKLLPGRKKRKSAEKQDEMSSDEAEKEAASDDEDSETPAVVPLSEFDAAETDVLIQTQAEMESYGEEEEHVQQELQDDSKQTEAKPVQNKEEAAPTPAAEEEPDEPSELSSKHQQLSDIPEEGVITETMATPAAEEAVRDDTIADDLMAITSEAITAPELADVTLADETEMISAVSQLSESSKTSGDTTPIPAEDDGRETESVLQQVAEVISSSPDDVPVCPDQPSTDICLNQHPTSGEQIDLLQTQRSFETPATNTEEEEERAATVQTDNMSDEAAESEGPTEEFDTAGTAVDEDSELSISLLEDLETTDESKHLVRGSSEVKEVVTVKTLPEGEEDRVENEASETDFKDSAAEEESRDVKQEVQILTEIEENIQNVSEDRSPVRVDETGGVQLLEEEEPEDAPAAERVTEEPEETAEHLSEETAEPQTHIGAVQAATSDSERPAEETAAHVEDASKPEHVPEPAAAQAAPSEGGGGPTLEKEISEDVPPVERVTDEPEETTEATKVLQAVQAATLESEEGGPQLFQKEETSKDVRPVADKPEEETAALTEAKPLDASEMVPEPVAAQTTTSEAGSPQLPAETVSDEPEETAKHLSEGTAEPENKETQIQTAEINQTEVTQVLEAASLVPEEGGPLISEDVPAAVETVRDEPNKAADVSAESEEPPLVEPGPPAEPGPPEAGSPQLVQKEDISEDAPAAEDTAALTEVNVKLVDASKAETVPEPEAAQTSTSESEDGGRQLLQKQEMLEDVKPAETMRNEPEETAEHLSEGITEPENKETQIHIDQTEVLEVFEAVRAAMLDSEDDGGPTQEKKISEDVPAADKPEEMTEHLSEPENKETQIHVDQTEVLEVLEAVRAAMSDSEEDGGPTLEKNISEDVPAADKPEEMTEHLSEPENKETQIHADQTEVLEVFEAVRAAMLDSEDDGGPTQEKKISEDVPAADKPEEMTEHLSEPENKETQIHVDQTEVLEAVRAAMSDSEEDGGPTLEKNISEDIPAADKPEKMTEHLSEPENKETQIHVDQTEVLEVLEAVRAAMLDSEEDGGPTLEKEMLEDVPAAEETAALTEVHVEPQDSSKPEHLQEAALLVPEEGGPLISEDVPAAVETVIDEPNQAAEDTVESEEPPRGEPGPPVEPEESQDAVTETAAEGAQSVEKEDVPPPAPVTEETESAAVAQLDEASETNGDQSIQPDVHEDTITEAADVAVLQTVPAVHFPSVQQEAGRVQVLEQFVFSEGTTAPNEESAEVSDEPTLEVHLCSVQVSMEGEHAGELTAAEMKAAAVQHAVVMQVITCNLKDVPDAIPAVLIQKTSETQEPLMHRVASGTEVKEIVEMAAALVEDNVKETAEEGRVVLTMHVPSVQLEESHRIQVQVVDIEIRSAENIVDAVMEVGVTNDKGVLQVCHETIDPVENLSTTPQNEEEVIHEKVTIQEVLQQVKENVPETVPEDEVLHEKDEVTVQEVQVKENVPETVPEEEVLHKKDKVTVQEVQVKEKVPEMVPEEEVITAMEREEPNEVTKEPVVMPTEHRESEDHRGTPKSPGGPEASIQEEEEETPAAMETQITVKSVSEAQTLQTAPPRNSSSVVPLNSGTISSVGNVESPASLSLEFKLNIQFGQAKIPSSPPPPVERPGPVRQTEVSEIGVQATENTEAAERCVITHQPVLMEIGVQAVERKEEVKFEERGSAAETVETGKTEEVKSAERGTLAVRATQRVERVEAEEVRPAERAAADVQAVEIIKEVQSAERGTPPVQATQTVETVETEKEVNPAERVAATVQAAETVEQVEAEEVRPTERGTAAVQPAETGQAVETIKTVEVKPAETVETVEEVRLAERVTATVKAVETVETVEKVEATATVKAVETVETVEKVEATATVQMAETVEEEVRPAEIETPTVQAVETIRAAERETPPVRTVEAAETVETMDTVETVESERTEVSLSQLLSEDAVKASDEEPEQDVWLDAEEDIQTPEKDVQTREEDAQIRDEDAQTQQEDAQTQQEDAQTQEEDAQTQEEDAQTQEEAAAEEEEEPQAKSKEEEAAEEEEDEEGPAEAAGTCEVDSEGEDFAVALEHPEPVIMMEWD